MLFFIITHEQKTYDFSFKSGVFLFSSAVKISEVSWTLKFEDKSQELKK